MQYTFSEAQLRHFVELTTQILLENSSLDVSFTKVSSHISIDDALHLEGATGIRGLSNLMPKEEIEVNNNQKELLYEIQGNGE